MNIHLNTFPHSKSLKPCKKYKLPSLDRKQKIVGWLSMLLPGQKAKLTTIVAQHLQFECGFLLKWLEKYFSQLDNNLSVV